MNCAAARFRLQALQEEAGGDGVAGNAVIGSVALSRAAGGSLGAVQPPEAESQPRYLNPGATLRPVRTAQGLPTDRDAL
jgi:hypothetical protein